jgi:hypothetical protein
MGSIFLNVKRIMKKDHDNEKYPVFSMAFSPNGNIPYPAICLLFPRRNTPGISTEKKNACP